MKKTYEMVGKANIQIDPPNDLRWIPVGFGQFEADIHPTREAFLIKIGAVVVVNKKPEVRDGREAKES